MTNRCVSRSAFRSTFAVQCTIFFASRWTWLGESWKELERIRMLKLNVARLLCSVRNLNPKNLEAFGVASLMPNGSFQGRCEGETFQVQIERSTAKVNKGPWRSMKPEAFEPWLVRRHTPYGMSSEVLVLVLLLTRIGSEVRFAICSLLLSFAVLETWIILDQFHDEEVCSMS